MENSILTLTFDDGRQDNYKVAKEILIKYNIPATFYIATAYIERKIAIGKNNPLDKKELDYLANNNLFEIAAHGDYHKNDHTDIENGIKKLRNWYPNVKHMGFASPHSQMTMKQALDNVDFFKKNNLEYIRIGNNFNNFYIEKLISKIAKITKSKLLYRWANQNSLIDSASTYVLVSVPIMKEHSFSQIKEMIDYAVKQRKWIIFRLHSVGEKNECPEYGSIWCWEYSKFDKLCGYISELRNEGKLKVMTAFDVVAKKN